MRLVNVSEKKNYNITEKKFKVYLPNNQNQFIEFFEYHMSQSRISFFRFLAYHFYPTYFLLVFQLIFICF